MEGQNDQHALDFEYTAPHLIPTTVHQDVLRDIFNLRRVHDTFCNFALFSVNDDAWSVQEIRQLRSGDFIDIQALTPAFQDSDVSHLMQGTICATPKQSTIITSRLDGDEDYFAVPTVIEIKHVDGFLATPMRPSEWQNILEFLTQKRDELSSDWTLVRTMPVQTWFVDHANPELWWQSRLAWLSPLDPGWLQELLRPWQDEILRLSTLQVSLILTEPPHLPGESSNVHFLIFTGDRLPTRRKAVLFTVIHTGQPPDAHFHRAKARNSVHWNPRELRSMARSQPEVSALSILFRSRNLREVCKSAGSS